MRSLRSLGFAAGIAASLIASSFVSIAHACSCTYTPTVADALIYQEAIFTGRVTEVTIGDFGYGEEKRVVFEVQEVWKGAGSMTVTVYTGPNDGLCGSHFDLDVEYLVYADEYQGRLYTHSCSRTGLKENNPDLEELGPPLITPTLPATWGQIKLHYR